MSVAPADDREEWSSTEITSWVTPKLEQILIRAAEIANEHEYNYLGDEHVLLAMLEINDSQLRRSWPPDGDTSDTLQRQVLDSLPPRQAAHIGPKQPVKVETRRVSPRI